MSYISEHTLVYQSLLFGILHAFVQILSIQSFVFDATTWASILVKGLAPLV